MKKLNQHPSSSPLSSDAIDGTSQTLDWRQRPTEFQQIIDQYFMAISNQSNDQWLYKGATSYDFLKFNDQIIIEKFIFEQYLKTGQTSFIIMDIGAGDFSWGDAVAKFINDNPLLRDNNIQVKIINIRGEKYGDPLEKKTGNCINYYLGDFKIECLIDELNSKEFNLIGQVDMIFSSFCFLHLLDPMGTLLQAYELLKNDTGRLCLDGFHIEINKNPSISSTIGILPYINATYYIYFNYDRQPNTYILQKTRTPSRIPLNYDTLGTYDIYTDDYPRKNFATFTFWPTESKSPFKPEKYSYSGGFSDKYQKQKKFNTTSTASEKMLMNDVFNHYEIIVAKLQLLDTLIENHSKNQAGALNDIHFILSTLIEQCPIIALAYLTNLAKNNYELAISILPDYKPPLNIFGLEVPAAVTMPKIFEERLTSHEYCIKRLQEKRRTVSDKNKENMPENVQLLLNAIDELIKLNEKGIKIESAHMNAYCYIKKNVLKPRTIYIGYFAGLMKCTGVHDALDQPITAESLKIFYHQYFALRETVRRLASECKSIPLDNIENSNSPG